MLEVSWGELGVVFAVGVFAIGRKDLPTAARVAGTQLGRVVGLLQGARARADRFAANNELRQLQNELRSGLRELDAVKTELAVSVSGRGVVGRSLGATVSAVNQTNHHNNNIITTQQQPVTSTTSTSTSTQLTTAAGTVSGNVGTTRIAGDDAMPPSSTAAAALAAAASTTMTQQQQQQQQQLQQDHHHHHRRPLPPERQTLGAVAELEWERQGISYKSRAEQGVGMMMPQQPQQQQGAAAAAAAAPMAAGPPVVDPSITGSALLAHVLQETLLFDQYDRVVQEHEDILQSKVQRIQERHDTAVQQKNIHQEETITTEQQGTTTKEKTE